jgi:ABC-type oligopeptide transport system ATPase subunit
MNESFIELKNLSIKHAKKQERTIDRMNLAINEGEILGLVGSSGCGKSTLAKTLVGLYPVFEGEIFYQRKLYASSKKDFRSDFRKEIQIVFQDPSACLNPRLSVLSILLEPLQIHERFLSKEQKIHKVCQILEQVGLDSSFLSRYPHELSGGQKQRICIARSLILKPRFLIFDEAVSALDASIQAQILNLLKTLKKELGFTLLFISHDLQIVHYLADRIAVISKGKIVEINTPDEIFKEPKDPYTKKLIELSKKYVV